MIFGKDFPCATHCVVICASIQSSFERPQVEVKLLSSWTPSQDILWFSYSTQNQFQVSHSHHSVKIHQKNVCSLYIYVLQ